MWDTGGEEKMRPLFRHYYGNSSAVIFVVDSNDRDRVGQAQAELELLLREDELRDATFLILANKQDLPRALSARELTDRLATPALTTRRWHLQLTCATTGEGLLEGIEWLYQNLPHR
eukprot:TRINITY_DN652_c0_g1_i2.p1 TRINITY_DN652_c0_g1~~TRINITY_DN652_c0_g1_i2.p1  ORF type:complete len:117 (+),score=32.50 TRINITY_DN652_c0_g1_i2:312-662(+)